MFWHRLMALVVAGAMVFTAGCSKNLQGSAAQHDAGKSSVKTFENPPNVIIIVASTLGYGDISANGNSRIATPNIDRIAKEGVTFTSAYTASSARGPSRASLFTGRDPSRMGFEYDNGPGVRDEEQNLGLPIDEVSLANMLHDRKYRTGLIGTWNLGNLKAYYPTNRGFDEFYGAVDGDPGYVNPKQPGIAFAASQTFQHPPVENRYTQIVKGADATVVKTVDRYLTTDFADHAVDFIDRNAQGRFLLTVAFNAPGQPLQAPQSMVDTMTSIADPRLKIYAAMIASLDASVGKILTAVDNRGLAQNTIVIFTSDAGCDVESGACPCDGLRGGAPTLYDGGLRVPLLMRWSTKIKPGSRYTKTVSLMDIAPTVIAAADAVRPAGKRLDGLDLIPFIDGKKKTMPHETLVWLRRPSAAIRYRDWKLIINPEINKTQLFDLATDPNEKNDLSEKRPDIVKEMRAQMEIDRSVATDPRWLSREKAALEFCNETLSIYR